MTEQDLLKEVIGLAMRLGHVEQERDNALRAAETAAEALKAATDAMNGKDANAMFLERRAADIAKDAVELRLRLNGYHEALEGLIVVAQDYQLARSGRRRSEGRNLAEAILNAKTFLIGQRPF